MDGGAVAQVRRFNRAVVRRVGALEEGYLGRDRPLGQARLLWEIGPEGAEVRELRARLGLDSGYLSRMLRALEGADLVVVDTEETDARVRRVRLTSAGRAERAELDRRSDALAASILEPLNPRQRDRLIAATGEVERLLTASTVGVAVTPPTRPEARDCLRAYAEELAGRFEGGFDPSVGPAAGAAEFTPPAGEFLVATLDGEPVGCVGAKFGADAAEIKRMWVAPAARGLGLARRLLAEIEERARVHGLRATRLDTNATLVEAIALYRSAGYREVPPFNDNPYAHHWFAKDLDPAG
ncbi:helix-turn-helix domain-containing GNAT family N-acetyltransferase [Pseudonocardia sp. NPDC049154]|uniref:bifunctional helix-turn-helix transcriptional regulator/GNAT family N-acetyltransferase n=1 Tax=Pseudonocardia sp. NPDC049154 TaxID=3155501 RepID=UPI0033FE2CE7